MLPIREEEVDQVYATGPISAYQDTVRLHYRSHTGNVAAQDVCNGDTRIGEEVHTANGADENTLGDRISPKVLRRERCGLLHRQ